MVGVVEVNERDRAIVKVAYDGDLGSGGARLHSTLLAELERSSIPRKRRFFSVGMSIDADRKESTLYPIFGKTGHYRVDLIDGPKDDAGMKQQLANLYETSKVHRAFAKPIAESNYLGSYVLRGEGSGKTKIVGLKLTDTPHVFEFAAQVTRRY